MRGVPVYAAERAAGIEDLVRSNFRVAMAATPSLVDPNTVPEAVRERAKASALKLGSAHAAVGDFDLHHMTSILVTVGWNKNDDVFDRLETWVARHTPEDKQLNYQHQDAHIIGHITANTAMDDAGALIDDGIAVDALPHKFHLVTAGVIYKNWQTPDLQKRADDLIAEMAQGKWFVSMECLFKGFDYALKDASGAVRVLARNEKTAFLSKHLRCYGGTGRYQEMRVGRVLRNIVFSGKGLVRDPANPESVILSSDPVEDVGAATACVDFFSSNAERVYSVPTPKESPRKMTPEQLQAQLEAAQAELAALKSSKAQTEIADLTAKLETAAKAEADAKAKAEASAVVVAQLTKDLEETKAKLAEASDELKKLHEQRVYADRVATVKEKLKLDETAAAKFVDSSKALSADAFEAQVGVMATAMTAWVTNNPASGNTNFSGVKPQAAPKSTDKPTAPKATDKPSGAKADADADDAGAAAADATDLSTAETNRDAALNTVPADSGVSDVQKAIAEAFGVKLEA